MTQMNSRIIHLRLVSQQLAGTNFHAVKENVRWMGAMQAQDFSMAKWAIGCRLPGSTEADVEASVSRGEIIRTHLLRPTWHFVAAEDVRWMLELTAPSIRNSLKSRHRELELTEKIFIKSQGIFEKALNGGRHLSRESLMVEVGKAGIRTDQNRSSHLLLRAELDGLLCSGAYENGKPTYALLDGRVPPSSPLAREEALGRLAIRYFSSHGPATIKDFSWWSGLGLGDVRRAIDLAGHALLKETFGDQEYFLSPSLPSEKVIPDQVLLLPAYDEIIISYRDRSAVLPEELTRKAISVNGLFYPVIIVNGMASGLWSRTMVKNKVAVNATFFNKPGRRGMNLTVKAARRFGEFLGKEVTVSFNSEG